MSDLAIVGAGVAGLAAAEALTRTALDVTVLERRDDVGGRATTRVRNGYTYDCGANYVKGDDDRVSSLIRSLGDDLVDVDGPVWTFDGDGMVSPGRDEDDHKWTYEDGLATLSRRLADRVDAAVRTGLAVTDLRRSADGWRLAAEDEDGRSVDLGTFDAVLLTPPGPTTGELIADAGWNAPLAQDLAVALSAVPYRTIHSIALGYSFAVDRPYYALVNVDRAHDVGWIAREECKRGHVPDGETLLVVQMAPEWSAERFGAPAPKITAAAADRAASLLDDARLADPEWTDLVRWRHALPDAAPDRDLLTRAADRDLYFAGDWVVGEGRVHLAIRSGLEAGDRIARRFTR